MKTLYLTPFSRNKRRLLRHRSEASKRFSCYSDQIWPRFCRSRCGLTGAKHRSYLSRPYLAPEITQLVIRMARENSDWEYDRIAGAPKNSAFHFRSDRGQYPQELRSFGIPPAPKRRQHSNWKEFIRQQLAMAGSDFTWTDSRYLADLPAPPNLVLRPATRYSETARTR
jgi:hypothetical protein